MDVNDLVNRFRHHPPLSTDTVQAHEKVRSLCLEIALELNTMLPDSREKSLAVTSLQEVMMWANAAIACGVATQTNVTTPDGDQLYKKTIQEVHRQQEKIAREGRPFLA